MAAYHTVFPNPSLLRRVARDIHDHVAAAAEQTSGMGVPEAQWEHLEGLRRKELKARRRGWLSAAAEMESLVHLSAHSLIRQLHEMCAWQEVVHSRRPQGISMHDIYRDLVNLEGEFEEVRIDRRSRVIIARTEPIELDEVNFGPFDIVLHWGDIDRLEIPFDVIAVHPVQCAADEAVTHPHVRDSRLCTGNGKGPIADALAHGNLFEFFMLVRQILRTYNPASAYQQIENWFNSDCSDCGCSLDEDEQYSCDHCSAVICNDCRDSCEVCSNSICQECSVRCSSCDSPVCRGCSEFTPDRLSRRCRDCIDEESEEASTTTEETHAHDHENEPPETAADESASHPAVHTRRVGENALSA